jgi:hypothetical protein
MADTTSGALPGLRAGSFTLRPAGSRTGFSTRNLLGTKAAPLTDPWSGEDDDTDYDYYDTLSGNIWRHGAEPGQPPATNPGGRAAGPLPGREAAAGVRPAGPRRLSSALIVRAWHFRPGRGSVRPDKETP